MRKIFLLVACPALLVLFVFLAVAVHKAKIEPEEFSDSRTPHAWLVGPPADALNVAAEQHIMRGFQLLNDRSLPPRERIQGYRERLKSAETLFERSLRAQPAQAQVLAQLGAIRWELNPQFPGDDHEDQRELIALAARMAPTVPAVQLELGELLLQMGRAEDAAPYISRAVELNPRTSRQAIELLRASLFDAETIVELLPRRPEVLARLRGSFVEDGMELRYVEIVEETLITDPTAVSRDLLIALGTSCLVLSQPDRLLTGMEQLGILSDDALEAARLQQRSRAYLFQGQQRRAIDTAREAVDKDPRALYLVQHLGDTALAAGEADAAIDAYRNGLGMLARGSGDPGARARLYSKIGRAEERRGRPDRAYDSYRMALTLDPAAPRARERIAAIEARPEYGPNRP